MPATEPKDCWDNTVGEYLTCPGDIDLARNAGAPPPKLCAGNPVNIATGNKYQKEVDYRGGGRFPLEISRVYNSYDGLWHFNIDRYLVAIPINGGDFVKLYRPDGKVYKVKGDFLNGWDIPASEGARLVKLMDNHGQVTGWQLVLSDDIVEHYNPLGKLTLITHRGLTQRLHYGPKGFPVSISDSFGRSISYTYSASNQVETITDPEGNVYTYIPDANGNLSRVVFPDQTPADLTDNPTRTYLYEDARHPHALTGIVDENGDRYATWAYDNQGRVVLSEHANGADRVAMTYNPDGTTTVTDANGAVKTIRYTVIDNIARAVQITGDDCLVCGGKAKSFSYDANGLVSSMTDRNGHVVNYRYNSRGLEISRTEASGTTQERTITTRWHNRFRLPVEVTEPGKTTTYAYDDVGLLTKKTETDRATGVNRSWTYTYNAERLLASEDGPRTDVNDLTTYRYDTRGNLIQISNALGQITQITAYDASGRPLAIVDPNGVQTTLTFDERGRLTSSSVAGEAVQMQYDNAGYLTRLVFPDNSYLSYAYDQAHRLTEIADAFGNRISYTLDASGNRTGKDVVAPQGRLVETHGMVYGLLNQLLQKTGANARIVGAYEYDAVGNLSRMTDAVDNVRLWRYDALDRLVRETDFLGNSTDYAYDSQGNLVSVSDPAGHTTSYQYDGFGNLVRLTSPDSGVTRYTYDLGGNVRTKQDANGHTTYYQYDALDRIVLTRYQDGSEETYLYDGGSYGIGRLQSVADGNVVLQWRYDPQGRVIEKIQKTGAQVFTVHYQYDAFGRLSQVGYPSGTVLDYTYENGKVSGISVNGVAVLSNVQYRAFGPATGWIWGNGLPHTRGFDQDGRMTSQSVLTDTRIMSYDPKDNLVSISDSRQIRQYGYDALDRLISEDARDSWLYQYDPVGNRTREKKSGVNWKAYRYAPDSNRQTGRPDSRVPDIGIDANGNLLDDGGFHRYRYDDRNRLAGVSQTVYLNYRPHLRQTDYVYNPLGQRVRKRRIGRIPPGDGNADGLITAADIDLVVRRISTGTGAPGNLDCTGNGQIDFWDIVCLYKLIGEGYQADPVSHYVYDEEGRLIGEYNGAGQAVSEIIYLQGEPVAMVSRGVVYYIHGDHRGAPLMVSDSANVVRWQADYTGFGKATVNEDPDNDGIRLELNIRLPGQYYDEETGLHYNYFRYYDPGTGRYISADPLGVIEGEDPNLYRYVKNNPIRWVDPFGLLTFSGGFGGSFQFGGAGASASGAIGFDTSGQICVQFTTCGRIGPGTSAGASFKEPLINSPILR